MAPSGSTISMKYIIFAAALVGTVEQEFSLMFPSCSSNFEERYLAVMEKIVSIYTRTTSSSHPLSDCGFSLKIQSFYALLKMLPPSPKGKRKKDLIQTSKSFEKIIVFHQLQAVAWLSLSLVSILFYETAIEIGDISEDSYGNIIYQLYLNKENDFDGTFIIYAKTFNYFMYIYLVLSFVWLVASCLTLWAVVREKWERVTNPTIFWSIITLTIALIDIILMSLVAADLQKAHDLYNPTTTVTSNIITSTTPTSITEMSTTDHATSMNQNFQMSTTDPVTSMNQNFQDRSLRISDTAPIMALTQSIYTSMGIVMTIAARGYILWVVNVTFAIMLIVLVQRIRKMSRPTLLPAIDAYAAGPRPFTLYEQTDIGNGCHNDAFNLDESKIFSPRQTAEPRAENFPRNPLSNSNRSSTNNSQSQMFHAPRPFENARGPPAVSKLAKIGKSGVERRTPPLNISSPVIPSGNMPYIPDPDYTPPGSPNSQPKSVLKARSKYVL